MNTTSAALAVVAALAVLVELAVLAALAPGAGERERAIAGGAAGVRVPDLARLRRRAALTQRTLAQTAQVARPTIVKGERGGLISVQAIRHLATALGVEPAALMGDEELPEVKLLRFGGENNGRRRPELWQTTSSHRR
jgi:DNA-binding XRE family transcriptional regulator